MELLPPYMKIRGFLTNPYYNTSPPHKKGENPIIFVFLETIPLSLPFYG